MSKNYYGEICKHCDIDKAKIKKIIIIRVRREKFNIRCCGLNNSLCYVLMYVR